MSDPEVQRRAADYMMHEMPHAVALGLKLKSLADNRVSVELPWRADLVSDAQGRVLAAGAVTTLLDHTCGLLMKILSEGQAGATLDLRIDYMRAAAPGASVTAAASCTKFTRTVAFIRAEAWDADPSDLVATVQAAFVVRGG